MKLFFWCSNEAGWRHPVRIRLHHAQSNWNSVTELCGLLLASIAYPVNWSGHTARYRSVALFISPALSRQSLAERVSTRDSLAERSTSSLQTISFDPRSAQDEQWRLCTQTDNYFRARFPRLKHLGIEAATLLQNLKLGQNLLPPLFLHNLTDCRPLAYWLFA